jgi:ketosteroid isomerase-like protein
MQVGLYEPLITGRNSEERQAGVRATVARFWQMLGDPPRTFPYQMPMTAAISPVFSARYPEAAIIFDNLHSMHDVISDILANPSVARDRKRAEILHAARLFRDDTSYVMPVPAWLAMAGHMGLENMGGPSVGFLPGLPTPTVTYGAVMTHDDQTGEMTGFKYGGAVGGEHAGHEMPAKAEAPEPVRPDTAHQAHGADSTAVVATVARFHEALERGDSAAALALLAPDAVILESGGAETVSDYRAHHLPADIEFARAIRSVRNSVRVTVQGDLAWAAGTSTTQGDFRGRPVNSAGAELMVLIRTSDGWRIAAIHWSSRRRTS